MLHEREGVAHGICGAWKLQEVAISKGPGQRVMQVGLAEVVQ